MTPQVKDCALLFCTFVAPQALEKVQSGGPEEKTRTTGERTGGSLP